MSYGPFHLLRVAALSAAIILCAASIYGQAPPAPAATPSPSPRPVLVRKLPANIFHDQAAIWTSPLRLRRDDARWLLPLTLSTGALMATDRRTARSLDDNQARMRVSRRLSQIGSGYSTGGIAASFYLIGRWRNDERARETGLLIAESLIDGAIVGQALKAATQRPRPGFQGGRGDFWDGGNSFPSGHSIGIWSLATIVASEYREHPLARVGAYGLATVVSISRFTARRHFLSDVLVGSAIGYGIGHYVYQTHHAETIGSPGGEESTARPKSRLFPFAVPLYNARTRGYGLSLKWDF